MLRIIRFDCIEFISNGIKNYNEQTVLVNEMFIGTTFFLEESKKNLATNGTFIKFDFFKEITKIIFPLIIISLSKNFHQINKKSFLHLNLMKINPNFNLMCMRVHSFIANSNFN